MFKTTAYKIWKQEQSLQKLITLCSDLDNHLGGGIALGSIMEFCGGPNCGKTQMCMQLCICVQIPKDCGGIGGKAIYIDTNQDFSPERLKEIAMSMSNRFQKVTQSKLTSANMDAVLENVLYNYCSNIKQLVAFVILLRNTLTKDPMIKLIVIDSYSSLLRQIDGENYERISISFEILTELQKLVAEFQIVIVLTNELTSRLNNNEWKIVPALGETHLHKINQRIILSQHYDGAIRTAAITKSPTIPEIPIFFQIKANGIRARNT